MRLPELITYLIIGGAIAAVCAVLLRGRRPDPSPGRQQNASVRNQGKGDQLMFGNNKKVQPAAPAVINGKPETVVGANTSFVGTMKSDGNVRIDGSVEGDVEILGNLIIGETGRVIATIKAQNVHVSGAVKGEITAVEQLEISPTGKVWGDIMTAALHIEPGGLFRGQSAMTTNIEEPLLLEAPKPARTE
jgi:cytoskeletal protein CcmA (bactofilin family)